MTLIEERKAVLKLELQVIQDYLDLMDEDDILDTCEDSKTEIGEVIFEHYFKEKADDVGIETKES